MKRDLIPKHIEKLCANKAFYFASYVFCPLGCGARVMRRDVLEHVSYYCQVSKLQLAGWRIGGLADWLIG